LLSAKIAGELGVQAVELLQVQKTFCEESALKLFLGKNSGYFCKYRPISSMKNRQYQQF
jgi:hypothetical protein